MLCFLLQRALRYVMPLDRQAITGRHAEVAMAGALGRRGSLPNKIVLALQMHSGQHQTAITFEVRSAAPSSRSFDDAILSVDWVSSGIDELGA